MDGGRRILVLQWFGVGVGDRTPNPSAIHRTGYVSRVLDSGAAEGDREGIWTLSPLSLFV